MCIRDSTGTAALTYSLAETPDVSQFTITADCTSSCTVQPLPATNTATFTLTFTPSSPAAVTTRIDISNNDPDAGDNPKRIDITGTGDHGVLATVPASPTTLDFGGVPQGGTKLIPFTLKNSGNVTVTGIMPQIGNPGLGYQIMGLSLIHISEPTRLLST